MSVSVLLKTAIVVTVASSTALTAGRAVSTRIYKKTGNIKKALRVGLVVKIGTYVGTSIVASRVLR